MTMWMEGNRSFFFGAQAMLIDNEREMATSWAAKHVLHNPAYKYVLGRFVEADRPNNNKQLFSLEGLQMARPTITHAPMNMNHAHRRVVGSYVATELIYPTNEAAADLCPNCGADMNGPVCTNCGLGDKAGSGEPCPKCGNPMGDGEVCPSCSAYSAAKAAGVEFNPYIEALGVFWKHYFPEDYALVEDAHATGRLYFSMECIPAQIQCAGGDGCGQTFEYAGRQSKTYCAHLNDHVSDKFLIDPHFTAGAILIPPVKPGWTHADVHSLVAQHEQLAERIHDGIKGDMGHLDPAQWESLMGELLVLATR